MPLDRGRQIGRNRRREVPGPPISSEFTYQPLPPPGMTTRIGLIRRAAIRPSRVLLNVAQIHPRSLVAVVPMQEVNGWPAIGWRLPVRGIYNRRDHAIQGRALELLVGKVAGNCRCSQQAHEHATQDRTHERATQAIDDVWMPDVARLVEQGNESRPSSITSVDGRRPRA